MATTAAPEISLLIDELTRLFPGRSKLLMEVLRQTRVGVNSKVFSGSLKTRTSLRISLNGYIYLDVKNILQMLLNVILLAF